MALERARALEGSLLLVLLILLSQTISGQTTMTEDSTNRVSTKTIYLIRHAESEENRRLAGLSRCFTTMGSFRLPSSSDVALGAKLLNIPAQVDSPVSPDGQAQIDQIAKTLTRDSFLEQAGVQLVAHSPLQRAKQTSLGMIGCVAPDVQHPAVGRVVELEYLVEKTPLEWVPGNSKSLATRIHQLEVWMAQQPESTILLVGHSQLFKAMLGLSFKLGNCDVWRVQLDGSQVDQEATMVMLQKTDMATAAVVDDNEHSYTLPRGWSGLKHLYMGKTGLRVGEKEAECSDTANDDTDDDK